MPPAQSILEGSFYDILFILYGIYLWDFVSSLHFDWAHLRGGNRKFHWPMSFYFIGRYLVMASLTGLVILFGSWQYYDYDDPFNGFMPSPTAVATLFQLTGVCAIGLSSINLAIRVIALWRANIGMTVIIFTLIAVHWTLIIASIVYALRDVHANYEPFASNTLLPSSALNSYLALSVSVVALMLDLIILALLWYRLFKLKHTGAAPTGKILIRDGTLYFVASLTLNTLSVAFAGIAVRSPWFTDHFTYGTIISGVLSTIIASQAVRRLSDHLRKREFVPFSGPKFSLPQNVTAPAQSSSEHVSQYASPVVHVQIETIVSPSHDDHVGFNSRRTVHPSSSSESLDDEIEIKRDSV